MGQTTASHGPPGLHAVKTTPFPLLLPCEPKPPALLPATAALPQAPPQLCTLCTHQLDGPAL